MIEFRAAAVENQDVPRPDAVDTPLSLVGACRSMERLRTEVVRAAAQDGPVLVTGEAGSGKSLVARAVHDMGPRAHRMCAVVSCRAFPETLLEVELFGCAKGGVVGASYDRRGMLEVVAGGTLILEDIDAASPRTRAMLDRYLSSGLVRSVGTFGPGTAVDTRVVATETAPPVGAHAPFHADPWSPPGLTRLLVPSLRERDADIPLLAQFFASVDRHHGGAVFSAEAIRALTRYSWPGNVTQLRRVVERLANAGVANPIQPRDLPVGIRPRPEGSAPKRHLSVGERLFLNVQSTGASFWAAVYPLFMKREITRADVRDLMGRALDTARGNRDELPRVLNLPSSDGQKLTRFLRKYGCDPVA